jgi:hypothetical protein
MPAQEQRPDHTPEEIHKLPQDKINELAEQAKIEIRKEGRNRGPLVSPAPRPPENKEPIPKEPRLSTPQQHAGARLMADGLQDLHHQQKVQALKSKLAYFYPRAQPEQVTFTRPLRESVAAGTC